METQENIDDWIEKQFAEGLPPEEEERLRRWVQADKAHRDYYDRRVFLYRWLRIQSRIPRFEKEKGKAYRRFLAQVEARRRRLPFGWSPVVWKRMACAAMLVLALGTGTVWWQQAGSRQAENVAQTVEVPSGVKRRVVLADGTKVWLNSGSKLRLEAGFGQEHRTLELDGEGMFEVAKDERLPFIIRSGDIRVRVTGTIFNFKAYPEERFAKVTLLQGSLDVSDAQAGGTRTVRMAPREQVVVDRMEDVMEKKSVEASGDVAWTAVGHLDKGEAGRPAAREEEDATQALVFDEMSMAEIVRRLESVFHVRIVVNVPALLQERYYGDFRGKDDIFDILDVMLRGEAVSYQIKGDTICIDE